MQKQFLLFLFLKYLVRQTQNGKQLVIEGVIITSPREKYYLKTEHDCDACPLCRLNLDIKHTVSDIF